jgi:hypothetical protein
MEGHGLVTGQSCKRIFFETTFDLKVTQLDYRQTITQFQVPNECKSKRTAYKCVRRQLGYFVVHFTHFLIKGISSVTNNHWSSLLGGMFISYDR